MSATSFQKYQEKILGVRGEGKRRGGEDGKANVAK